MLTPLGQLTPLTPSTITGAVSGAASAAESAAASAAGAVASATGTVAKYTVFGGMSPGQWVMVILGLLLIAAGIFQFDKARAVIVKAGKAATETAAAAA